MTVVEAIKKIVSERGSEVLLDPRTVNSYVADLAQGPSEQLKLYRVAASNGILEIIYKMENTTCAEEHEALKNKAIHKLVSDALLSLENASKAVKDVICQQAEGRAENEPKDQWMQYNLGYSFEFGQNDVQDYEKAVYWYMKSAEQGNAWAQNRLGDCYLNGNGIAQNLKCAVEWYTKSAEQGDQTAQYNLGLCYSNGNGVPVMI